MEKTATIYRIYRIFSFQKNTKKSVTSKRSEPSKCDTKLLERSCEGCGGKIQIIFQFFADKIIERENPLFSSTFFFPLETWKLSEISLIIMLQFFFLSVNVLVE